MKSVLPRVEEGEKRRGMMVVNNGGNNIVRLKLLNSDLPRQQQETRTACCWLVLKCKCVYNKYK
jgi:hypothetical protein